ncbi:hypothetical protein SAMN02910265_01068 [Ruminococcus flavefaciens]|uniref:Uncharacterized protein n=1 Tax=Ruminococcus flavefaciens TaxID=1265 RepID=A0A1H6INM3_RUMFL|nr:hypothetical protein [Ruminococcus flavefaciens]SEH50708.1 hypothetical protein SAMN02910265_01068 [Ruminococcus flavefaciens]
MYNYQPKKPTKTENERKDKVKSVRMSKDEEKKINDNANKAGMSFGSYMVNVAANGGNKFTPADLVEFQNTVNDICNIVKENAPDKVQNMQEGAFKLWRKLI